MLRALVPAADLVVLTRADHPRAAEPGSLDVRGCPAVTARSVPEALATALALARPADAVVVTGSFYDAGEALAALGYGG
jgi:folylpolyglutamate synthase/dihydropteroate synthase